MDDVIRHQSPKDYFSKFLQTFLIFAIPSLIAMILLKTFLVPSIFLVIALLHPLINKLGREPYDGWSIEDNKIILTRKTLTGMATAEIFYSDIDQLQYFRGFRKAEPKLIFISNNTKVWLAIRYDSFKMANTLKYFKNKGINVKLMQSDAELQMYLDNKVDKIPITNNY